MGRPRDELALRAIVVGTRAAVSSHRAHGTERMIRASAERGLALLRELEARVREEADPELGRAIDEARQELTALLHGAEPPSNERDERLVSRRE